MLSLSYLFTLVFLKLVFKEESVMMWVAGGGRILRCSSTKYRPQFARYSIQVIQKMAHSLYLQFKFGILIVPKRRCQLAFILTPLIDSSLSPFLPSIHVYSLCSPPLPLPSPPSLSLTQVHTIMSLNLSLHPLYQCTCTLYTNTKKYLYMYM